MQAVFNIHATAFPSLFTHPLAYPLFLLTTKHVVELMECYKKNLDFTQYGQSESHKILNMVYPLLDCSIAFSKLLIQWHSS